jgi:hypothetical protein
LSVPAKANDLDVSNDINFPTQAHGYAAAWKRARMALSLPRLFPSRATLHIEFHAKSLAYIYVDWLAITSMAGQRAL